MDWRIKGVVQKALSVVPLGTALNDALQRGCGGLRNFGEHVATKVNNDWVPLCQRIADSNKSCRGVSMVEIGTGWHPCLPTCVYLAGAAQCVTFDLHRHLNRRLTFQMLQHLGEHLSCIAQTAGAPRSEVEARYRRLSGAESLEDFLGRSHIQYHAPADAGASELAASSVDIIFSNDVLEHVSPDALRRLMAEAARTLRPDGIAVHSINCGDHYAYFDRSITQANYLQFSEREWRRWNTRLQYQNRLRPSDFLSSAERCGLRVRQSWARPRPEMLAQVAQMKIAPEFRGYSPAELATSSLTFVASPSAMATAGDAGR